MKKKFKEIWFIFVFVYLYILERGAIFFVKSTSSGNSSNNKGNLICMFTKPSFELHSTIINFTKEKKMIKCKSIFLFWYF